MPSAFDVALVGVLTLKLNRRQNRGIDKLVLGQIDSKPFGFDYILRIFRKSYQANQIYFA